MVIIIKQFFLGIFNLIYKSKLLIKFINNYIQISSLPCGFLINNKYILLLILICFFFSFILTTKLIYLFKDFFFLFNLIIGFSILNLLYLKFNLIIRIYHIFIKSIPYLYFLILLKDKDNLKKMFWYYIINIFFSLFSFLIIYKIGYNLNIYSNDLYSYSYLYTNLFSCLFGLMYLDFISNNIFKLSKVKINILSFIISFILLIIFLFLIYFLGSHLSKLDLSKLDLSKLDLSKLGKIDFKILNPKNFLNYLHNSFNDFNFDDSNNIINKEFNFIHESNNLENDKNIIIVENNNNIIENNNNIVENDNNSNNANSNLNSPFINYQIQTNIEVEVNEDPFGINSPSFAIEIDKAFENNNIDVNNLNSYLNPEEENNITNVALNNNNFYLQNNLSDSNESLETIRLSEDLNYILINNYLEQNYNNIYKEIISNKNTLCFWSYFDYLNNLKKDCLCMKDYNYLV
jgi:hypothetical protein